MRLVWLPLSDVGHIRQYCVDSAHNNSFLPILFDGSSGFCLLYMGFVCYSLWSGIAREKTGRFVDECFGSCMVGDASCMGVIELGQKRANKYCTLLKWFLFLQKG